MHLNYILYASQLTHPLTHLGLAGLLKECETNNDKNDITGFLHIEDDIVLQYLEGPSEMLFASIEKIRADARHHHFEILDQGVLQTRFFEGWQMALVENTTLSLFDLLGVTGGPLSDVGRANPLDLITLLSANASYLRDSPAAL